MAANPQTKPVDLGWESAENWQLSSTSTIHIYRTEPTTKMRKTEKLKCKNEYAKKYR